MTQFLTVKGETIGKLCGKWRIGRRIFLDVHPPLAPDYTKIEILLFSPVDSTEFNV
jgi:hypothetical protein